MHKINTELDQFEGFFSFSNRELFSPETEIDGVCGCSSYSSMCKCP